MGVLSLWILMRPLKYGEKDEFLLINLHLCSVLIMEVWLFGKFLILFEIRLWNFLFKAENALEFTKSIIFSWNCCLYQVIMEITLSAFSIIALHSKSFFLIGMAFFFLLRCLVSLNVYKDDWLFGFKVSHYALFWERETANCSFCFKAKFLIQRCGL